MKLLFLLKALIFCAFPVMTYAFDTTTTTLVKNVQFEASGQQIIVSYDLLGKPDESYSVILLLKRDSDHTFSYSPINVSGDLGTGLHSGLQKKIFWDFKEEFPQGLSGSDYYFVIIADEANSGIPPLLWAGAGLAAIGGVITYLILTNPGEADIASAPFPSPPGRP